MRLGGFFFPFPSFFFAPWHAAAFVPCLPEDFFGSPLEEAGGRGCRSPEPRLQLGAGQREERGIQCRGSGEKKRWKDCQCWLCAASLRGQIGEETVKRWKLPVVGKEGAGSGVLLALSTPLVWSQTLTGFFLLCFLKPWCEITGGNLQEEQSWRLGAAPLPAPCCRD